MQFESPVPHVRRLDYISACSATGLERPLLKKLQLLNMIELTIMMQATGEGEASSLKMRAISSAITLGTKFENKFSSDYIWRKMRLDHPRLICPAKAIDNEDRRVDWLTYQNITDWNIAAKSFLISIGMGTEDRGLIRKCFVWFLFSFADNSTNSLVCSFVSFQTPSRAPWVLSTKTMSIGF